MKCCVWLVFVSLCFCARFPPHTHISHVLVLCIVCTHYTYVSHFVVLTVSDVVTTKSLFDFYCETKLPLWKALWRNGHMNQSVEEFLEAAFSYHVTVNLTGMWLFLHIVQLKYGATWTPWQTNSCFCCEADSVIQKSTDVMWFKISSHNCASKSEKNNEFILQWEIYSSFMTKFQIQDLLLHSPSILLETQKC